MEKSTFHQRSAKTFYKYTPWHVECIRTAWRMVAVALCCASQYIIEDIELSLPCAYSIQTYLFQAVLLTAAAA